MEGWIKIHRKILDNPIVCKDSDTLSIWVYLLLNATHVQMPILFKGKRTILKEGQLVTGILSISKKLNIDKNKVQRTLKLFENDKQIEQQTSNQNRLVTILNWNAYQNSEKQNDKPVINEWETDDKRVITNKNVKNIKNDKNVRITTVSDSCGDDLQEVIEFYNNNIGSITPYIVEVLSDYLKDLNKELIILAMKKSVEANKRFIQYIKGILNNWIKKGITTVVEAEEENNKYKNKTAVEEWLNE